MNIDKHIELIEKSIEDPTKGLPENIFRFLSRLTPMVNVDLLIKNTNNQTLLTWRGPGQTCDPGWHVPGGIVRYKEKIFDRIHAVAKSELKTKIIFDDHPLAMNEMIRPLAMNEMIRPLAMNEMIYQHITRGHFISFLYSCKMIQDPDINLQYLKGSPKVGEWAWHDSCPDNIFFPHKKIYKDFI